MPTLWIHAGLPKTGSSALQVFFERNIEGLARNGIAYPFPTGIAAEGQTTSGNGYWLARRNGLPTDDWGMELRRLWRRQDVLLSSEFFASSPDSLWAALARNADQRGALRVLVYLREPADLIRAHHIHHCARDPGPHLPLDEYAADYWAERRYIRFGEYLDRLAEIIGPGSVTVRSYTQARARLASDFIEAMGLDPGGFDLRLPVVNDTPPAGPPDPRVIQGVREASRPEAERAVRRWFPGQSVDDVFDFPPLS